VRDKLRPADGDAAGDSDTVQDEAHAAWNGEGRRGRDITRKAMKLLRVWSQESALVPGFIVALHCDIADCSALYRRSIHGARSTFRLR
jgi:hypothetical protein